MWNLPTVAELLLHTDSRRFLVRQPHEPEAGTEPVNSLLQQRGISVQAFRILHFEVFPWCVRVAVTARFLPILARSPWMSAGKCTVVRRHHRRQARVAAHTPLDGRPPDTAVDAVGGVPNIVAPLGSTEVCEQPD
jgi:hypothetical protein